MLNELFPDDLANLAGEFVAQDIACQLLERACAVGKRGAHQAYGIALVIRVGKDLKHDGTLLGLRAEETVTYGKIFLLAGSAHVLKTQILGIVLDQLG